MRELILFELAHSPEVYRSRYRFPWGYRWLHPKAAFAGLGEAMPWEALGVSAVGVAGRLMRFDYDLGTATAASVTLALVTVQMLRTRTFVTPSRIVRQRGLLGTSRSEIPLRSIREGHVVYSNGIPEEFGDVVLMTTTGEERLLAVPDPEGVLHHAHDPRWKRRSKRRRREDRERAVRGAALWRAASAVGWACVAGVTPHHRHGPEPGSEVTKVMLAGLLFTASSGEIRPSLADIVASLENEGYVCALKSPEGCVQWCILTRYPEPSVAVGLGCDGALVNDIVLEVKPVGLRPIREALEPMRRVLEEPLLGLPSGTAAWLEKCASATGARLPDTLRGEQVELECVCSGGQLQNIRIGFHTDDGKRFARRQKCQPSN